MKKVAIITVSFNGADDTLEFLDSLKNLDTKGLETKIVVVDNGSTDDSVEKILKKYPNIDLLQTGINTGFTGGFNRGLEYAHAWGADYYLIINNDTLINSKDLLGKLVQTADGDEKIGLVAPKIYFAPGFEFYKDRYTKEDEGKVIWFAGGSFDWSNIYSVHRGMDEVDQGLYDKIEETEYLSGCCLLIKKEVIEKVGFFDPKLFAYYEDFDLLFRIHQASFKTYYDGRVSIYHKVSQGFRIGSESADYYSARNRLYLGFKYTNSRTKFALIREAFKFLLVGRPAQREGVLDFIQSKFGPRIPQKEVDTYQIDLSVVVVNYNTADLVKAQLESIYKKDSGLKNQRTEVILLDNGNLDLTDKIIQDYPEVRYIQNKENTGFTKGYNRAMKYTRGKQILMLNSDIEVLENGLAEIYNAAQENEDKAVIIGKLYFPDLREQDSALALPTITGAIKEYFFKQKGAYFMYTPEDKNKPTKVEGGAMACFLIPRKILNKVGFLDEGTFIFFEDVEYCRRLKNTGVPVYYYPNAKFIHHHGASTKKLKEGEAYQKLITASKHYHGTFYYYLIYATLWFCQKFSGTSSPGEVR